MKAIVAELDFYSIAGRGYFKDRRKRKNNFSQDVLQEDLSLLYSACVLDITDSLSVRMVTWGEQVITTDKQGQISQCHSC